MNNLYGSIGDLLNMTISTVANNSIYMQYPVWQIQQIQQQQQSTFIVNDFGSVTAAPGEQSKPAMQRHADLAWLDRRVDELRVAL